MTDHAFTEFEQLILNSKNQLGTSILLVLAWIASSDGHIDAQEAKQLSEISSASKHGISVQPIIRLAQKRDIEALQLACEIVASDFVNEKALRFLEMAIGMAIADGRLLPSENHILRFLADLLGVSNSSLNEIFINVTGRAIPFPSDVSSAEYWRERDNGNMKALESYGINIAERVPLHVGRNPHNEHYLNTKQSKLGHWLETHQDDDPV